MNGSKISCSWTWHFFFFLERTLDHFRPVIAHLHPSVHVGLISRHVQLVNHRHNYNVLCPQPNQCSDHTKTTCNSRVPRKRSSTDGPCLGCTEPHCCVHMLSFHRKNIHLYNLASPTVYICCSGISEEQHCSRNSSPASFFSSSYDRLQLP